MNRSVIWLFLFLLPVLPLTERAAGQTVTGQSDIRSPGYSSLSVRADVDSALVLIDGQEAGRAPLTLDSLTPGLHHVRILHPDISNWLTGSLSDSVTLSSGERKVVSYQLGRHISINTTPSGASLFITDSLSGVTPLTLWLDSTQRASLVVLRKEGYLQETLRPWEASRGFVNIRLSPEMTAHDPGLPGQESVTGAVRSTLPLYVSGAATILSGAVAAYLKNRADERQALYLASGEPGLLAERNRLDSWSGALLVTTQIGFGLFTYFLLSQ